MVELRVESASGGGASVGRDVDGRVIFVDAALPGELVEVVVTQEKKRFARAVVDRVIEPAAGRIEAKCPTSRAGCGGCDLAHAERSLQLDMKTTVVRDALERIGGVDALPEVSMLSKPADRYRTTVRAAVDGSGRAGYRRRRSNAVVTAETCLVAHESIEEVLREGLFPGSNEVVIRASVFSGERLVVVDGPSDAVEVPAGVDVVPAARAAERSITERVAGREWRVSAASFFQSGPIAAGLLVQAVEDSLGELHRGHLVDAYAGIGLFAGSVGGAFDHVTAIERAPSSVADARYNLAPPATVVDAAVERWAPQPADVVIADPARAGLGQQAVDVLAATGARRFVLVSCDPGSMGRDVGLLGGHGFALEAVRLVDAFADTSHVETVLALQR